MIHLPLISLLRPELSVKLTGIADHPKLLREIGGAVEPCVVLDFAKVTVLTTSYWSAAFAPLWRSEAVTYPVVANLAAAVEDELRHLSTVTGFACWHGAYRKGAFVPTGIIGSLDKPYEVTLNAVRERGSAFGAELVDVDDSVKPTAWNNRLAHLGEKRLLRRTKGGRQVTYSLPWVEG